MLIASSCDDLTEINKNPNQLNASDINIKYVLTSVLSSTGEIIYMNTLTAVQ